MRSRLVNALVFSAVPDRTLRHLKIFRHVSVAAHLFEQRLPRQQKRVKGRNGLLAEHRGEIA
jgi:hypothetical protein